MWALGILLYELVVGIPPFYSKMIREMYDLILFGKLEFPPFLTEECQNFISQLLIRNPDDRMQQMGEIQAHPFFESIDWDKLYSRKIKPLYKPPRLKGIDDTSMFEPELTEQVAVDTPEDHFPSMRDKGFTLFSFDYRQSDDSALSSGAATSSCSSDRDKENVNSARVGNGHVRVRSALKQSSHARHRSRLQRKHCPDVESVFQRIGIDADDNTR